MIDSDIKDILSDFKRLRDIPHFISFEGIEGSGKTTQAKILTSALKKIGLPAILVKDPGTTKLGEKIRKILKSHIEISPTAELFLFLSARRQLVEEVIKPALRKGKIVISDRFSHSTLAYQGRGRMLFPETLPMLCYLSTGGVEPEIVIVIDVKPEVGISRLKERYRQDESKKDRFEREGEDFLRRVREYYLEISKTQENVFIVDGENEPAEVFKMVLLKIYNFSKEKYGLIK